MKEIKERIEELKTANKIDDKEELQLELLNKIVIALGKLKL